MGERSGSRALEIANISLDDFTPDEILEIVKKNISEKSGSLFIVTADILGSYKRIFDAEYHSCVNGADIVTCDGAGLKLLTYLKYPRNIKNKVSGIDLMQKFLAAAGREGYKAAFIGSRPEVVKRLSGVIERDYPGISDPFFHDGYFDARERSSMIERLMKTKPDIVFVALGNPAQEKFIDDIRRLFSGTVFIGVGGSFDVVSGTLRRAPAFMRDLYLEWLYRLFQEPRRILRMLNIPKYIIYVLIYEAIKWLFNREPGSSSR